MKKWGAVPFVLTNVPQSMKSYGCSNPIYGVTANPHDLNRSPGGSTGGEAALIADGGSILGIGGDTGGSIRVPAHFTGIVGFRPTSERSTSLGAAKSYSWCPGIHAVKGPLTRDVDAMVKFYQLYWSTDQSINVFHIDPILAPVPFDTTSFQSSKPLRIGYYVKDNFCPPVPACQRAVQMVKDLLEKSGHNLFLIPPISIRAAAPMYFSLTLQDKGKWLQKKFSKDIVEPNHQKMASYLNPSSAMVKVARFVQKISGQPKPNMLFAGCNLATNLDELRERFDSYAEFRRKIVDQWSDLKLDVVICPVFGTFALPQDKCSQLLYSSSYAGVFNLLDFPAGVVPVTKVTQQDETNMIVNYDRSTIEKNNVYNGSLGGVGMPVGVQIVSLPYRDEKCLRVMKEIEDLLNDK